MPESEANFEIEIGLPEVIPVKASLKAGYTRRWTTRGAEVVEAISVAAGGADALEARAAASEEVDVLLARAAVAGADSALGSKRRLLAKVVAQAVLDDAAVDEAALIVDVLTQVDAVHVRALEAIRRAEEEARRSGEMSPTARGAEKELTAPVQAVTKRLPEAVLRRLESLGLVAGSLTWDGLGQISGLTTFGEGLLADLRSTEI